jgi:hypothetical protein
MSGEDEEEEEEEEEEGWWLQDQVTTSSHLVKMCWSKVKHIFFQSLFLLFCCSDDTGNGS